MTNPSNTWDGMTDENCEELNALLQRYCLSLTRSLWDSEDLVQTTWVKFLDRMKERRHNNPEALLLRTAKNTWIDQLRRNKVFERLLNMKRELVREEVDAPIDSGTSTAEIAFHHLITHLPPLQRSVLVLRGIFDYSARETADKLQSTEGAVKAAYYRARKCLDGIELEVEEVRIAWAEEERFQLNALAKAYMNGDVDEVLRLIRMEHEHVQAVGACSTPIQSGFDSASCVYMAHSCSLSMAA